MVDTAGLRDTGDAVERLGIERTWAAVERADLALVLVDARESGDGITPDDRAILARLPARAAAHRRAQQDRPRRRAPAAERASDRRQVWLSALDGAGVDLLEREVLAIAGVEGAGRGRVHRARAPPRRRCATPRRISPPPPRTSTSQSPPLELYAEELREAQNALASITGEFTADDLLGVIFSRFCIGK